MKNYRVSIIVVLLFAVIGCNQQKEKVSLADTPEQKEEISTESELESHYKSWFNQRFVREGDSWFTIHSDLTPWDKPYNPLEEWVKNVMVEYKGLTYAVDSYELSEADKLNGVLFEGVVYLKCTVSRYKLSEEWSSWMDSGPLPATWIKKYASGKTEVKATVHRRSVSFKKP